MACIQYPRKERGGVSLGSWEQPTIYKDPPKEIMTRKKERIEEGDITYNIRNEPGRYNDAITNWQKGKNMMVKVDYQNTAPQTTTMNFGSSSNPYKVNQAFRPPMFREVDLQPLSRQQRPYTAATANSGSQITRIDYQDDRTDRSEIQFATGIQPIYKETVANVSNEMGVYQDNHERSDMINEDYVAKQITSQLKGMESVELQKLFEYENTPNGIILKPIAISVDATMSGPSNVETHRNIQANDYTTEVINLGMGTNNRGTISTEGQTHLPNNMDYLRELRVAALGTNQSGHASIDGQRNLSGEKSHLQHVVQIGQGSNLASVRGIDRIADEDQKSFIQQDGQVIQIESTRIGPMMVTDDQRNISQEQAYVQNVVNYGQGSNLTSRMQLTDQQRSIQEHQFVQSRGQVALGSNMNSALRIQKQLEQQDKMKDILLKNMKSNVSIIIQQGASTDEYQINGNIKDKIGIVVNSTKGTPLVFNRENGEPIKLKDYTWKFVKSASGADKFIIQVPHEELELERKAELYAVYSNPNQGAKINHDGEEVVLRREMRNVSAVSNVNMQGDIDRVDESITQRVEKLTHYTDMMIQTVQPSLDRSDGNRSAIRPHESSKKQHISQTMLAQSQGRFDN